MYTLLSALALVACVSAGRLENRYLAPIPSTAQSAGGGADLQAPFNAYLPPQQQQPAPAAQQDAPVVIDAFQRQGQFSARAQAPARQIAIIRLANENPGDGNYAFSYETEDGTVAEERGQLKGGDAEGIQSAQGSYSFTAPDNVRYTVTYTADENGFQAQGAHLPVPPPIPEAILKALADNAADEARGIVDDGSYREEYSNSQQRTSQQQGYPRDRPNNGGYRY